MAKSVSIILVCAAVGLLLTGCWDRKELNELGITSAVGFDWSDGKWNISFQVIVPSGMWTGGGGGNPGSSQSTIHVFSAEGRTIREAVSKSNMEIPRQLYFSHTDTIIIGKSAAEHGLSEVIELYLRSVQARETVVMAVTEERAADVLKLFMPLERIPGDAINHIILKEELNSGNYPAVRVLDFARALYAESRTIGVPELNVKGNRDEQSRKRLATIDSFKQSFNDSKLTLTGLSVFRDGRRIGRLNRRESFGVAWLSGTIKQSSIAFACPAGSNPNALSSYRIDRTNTAFVMRKTEDGYRIAIRVNVRGELTESECKLDLTKTEAVRQLGDAIEREIEHVMNDGWNAIRRLKADLPGFADKIHRKYPADRQRISGNSPDGLANVTIEPRVNVSVIRMGLSHKPLQQDKSGVEG